MLISFQTISSINYVAVGSFVGQTSPTEVPLLIFYYEIDIELRMR